MISHRTYLHFKSILVKCMIIIVSTNIISHETKANPLRILNKTQPNDPYQGQEVCIQAGNGQYIAIKDITRRRVVADSKTCGDLERFRIVRSRQHSFAIYHLKHS